MKVVDRRLYVPGTLAWIITQRVSNPKGLEPKGPQATDMGYVSKLPETGLQPQVVNISGPQFRFEPKGACFLTVDCQFQKEQIPHYPYRKQWAMSSPHAPSRRDGRCASHALSYLLCLPGVRSISELSKPPLFASFDA